MRASNRVVTGTLFINDCERGIGLKHIIKHIAILAFVAYMSIWNAHVVLAVDWVFPETVPIDLSRGVSFSDEEKKFIEKHQDDGIVINFFSTFSPTYMYYGSYKGYIADIMQIVSDKTGLPVKLVVQPSVSDLEEQVGVADNSLTHMREGAFPETVAKSFKHEDLRLMQRFYAKKDKIESFSGSSKVVIGVMTRPEFLSSIELEKKLSTAKFVYFNTFFELANALQNDEIDVMLSTVRSAQIQANYPNVEEIPFFEPSPLRMFFYGQDILVSILNKTLGDEQLSSLVKKGEMRYNRKMAGIEPAVSLLMDKLPTPVFGIFDEEPFQFIADEKIFGVPFLIIDELKMRFGYNVGYEHGSFEEILNQFYRGEIDAIFVPKASFGESSFIRYTDYTNLDLFASEYKVYGDVHTPSFNANNEKIRLGYLNDFKFYVDNKVVNNGEKIKFVHFKSIDSLTRAVSKGKIDYALIDDNVTSKSLMENLVGKGTFGNYKYVYLIRNDSKIKAVLLELFEVSSEKIKESNEYFPRLKYYQNVYDSTQSLERKDAAQNRLILLGRVAIAIGFFAVVFGSISLLLYKRKRYHDKWESLKYQDFLTKLLNRFSFEDKISEWIARGDAFTLCVIDLDYLKHINDTYGHRFGDEVIIFVADTLKKVCPQEAIVGRVGGDEYVFAVIGLDKNCVSVMLDQILAELKAYDKLPLGCSIGICEFPTHGENYPELFKKADAALYKSKDAGRGRYTFFDNGANESK